MTATFGTADLAGSDILAHNVATHHADATGDEMLELWQIPGWVLAVIEAAAPATSTGAGFYKDRRAVTIDPATLEYRPFQKPEQPSLQGRREHRRRRRARQGDHRGRRPRRQVRLGDRRRHADLLGQSHPRDLRRHHRHRRRHALGLRLGPGSLRALGRAGRAGDGGADESDGRAIPEWVARLAASEEPSFYLRRDGQTAIWGPGQTEHAVLAPKPRTIKLSSLKATGRTITENEHAGLIDLGDRVACVEFRTKANIASLGALAFIEEAIEGAGAEYDALVIGNQGGNFSGGADLKMMVEKIEAEDWDGVDATLKAAQRASMAIKYSPVPVVAAPFGRVLGGGLEVCLHCAPRPSPHRRQHGPGRDQRRPRARRRRHQGDVLRATAAHAGEAILSRCCASRGRPSRWPRRRAPRLDATDLGYLRGGDGITMNRESVIYAAQQVARAARGHRLAAAPVPATVAVRAATASPTSTSCSTSSVAATSSATTTCSCPTRSPWVLCGGDVDPGTVVDEQFLLDLERQAFLTVCRTPKTMERLQAMLTTGKPLRN